MLDSDFLGEIQAVVLEPVDGGLHWPSGLWTRDEVLAYCTERQNQFLKESGILASTGNQPVTAGTAVVDLPEDWMATIQVAWRRTSTGLWSPVWPSDAISADYGHVEWMSVASPVPLLWSDAERPVPALRLLPTPSADGQVFFVYVATAQPVTGTGDPLETPDDFCVFLRYGVLASMFGKEGRGQDLNRAKACEARFQEGIDLGKGLLRGWA